MKKTLTILSLILITLISFNANAQDDKPQAKSYLGVIGGLSLPNDDFASTTYSNNKAGFAKTGVTFGLDGAVYIHKNLGIGFLFSFQDQGELTGPDALNLSNGYNASFQKDETVVTGVNRYHNLQLLVGPQYSFVIKSFTIDLRASAGYIKSISTPTTSVVFDQSGNSSLTLEQVNSTALAFAYGASAGLRWRFADAWDIGIRASYVNSDGLNITNRNNPGTVGRFVTKQPISILQTTIGIMVHL